MKEWIPVAVPIGFGLGAFIVLSHLSLTPRVISPKTPEAINPKLLSPTPGEEHNIYEESDTVPHVIMIKFYKKSYCYYYYEYDYQDCRFISIVNMSLW